MMNVGQLKKALEKYEDDTEVRGREDDNLSSIGTLLCLEFDAEVDDTVVFLVFDDSRVRQ